MRLTNFVIMVLMLLSLYSQSSDKQEGAGCEGKARVLACQKAKKPLNK